MENTDDIKEEFRLFYKPANNLSFKEMKSAWCHKNGFKKIDLEKRSDLYILTFPLNNSARQKEDQPVFSSKESIGIKFRNIKKVDGDKNVLRLSVLELKIRWSKESSIESWEKKEAIKLPKPVVVNLKDAQTIQESSNIISNILQEHFKIYNFPKTQPLIITKVKKWRMSLKKKFLSYEETPMKIIEYNPSGQIHYPLFSTCFESKKLGKDEIVQDSLIAKWKSYEFLQHDSVIEAGYPGLLYTITSKLNNITPSI